MEEQTAKIEKQTDVLANAIVQIETFVKEQNNQVLNFIDGKFNTIAELFAEKLAYDQSKQQQIDQLHQELQRYKTDLIAKTNRPLINAIVKLYQDIGKTLDNLKTKPTSTLTNALFFERIDDIQDDVNMLLEQHGIQHFTEAGTLFNPRRQRGLKNIETSDTTLHGQVCERVRPGFEYANEMLQKELVNLFVYKETTLAVNQLNTAAIDQTAPVHDPQIPIVSEMSQEDENAPDVVAADTAHVVIDEAMLSTNNAAEPEQPPIDTPITNDQMTMQTSEGKNHGQ